MAGPSLACAFATHPALQAGAAPDAWNQAGTNIPWTLDMDDMLRTAVRRAAFDFDAASRHIQSYVMRVRASGGILPDSVVEPLYTVDACRERWAHLDFCACQVYRRVAAGEQLPSDGNRDMARALAAAMSTVERPREPPKSTAPASDDDDDDDDDGGGGGNEYGIVDLDALRAQRLGNMFHPARSGAPPKSEHRRAARPSTGAASALRLRLARPLPTTSPSPSPLTAHRSPTPAHLCPLAYAHTHPLTLSHTLTLTQGRLHRCRLPGAQQPQPTRAPPLGAHLSVDSSRGYRVQGTRSPKAAATAMEALAPSPPALLPLPSVAPSLAPAASWHTWKSSPLS